MHGYVQSGNLALHTCFCSYMRYYFCNMYPKLNIYLAKYVLYPLFTHHTLTNTSSVYERIQSGNPAQLAALQAWTLLYTAHVHLKSFPQPPLAQSCVIFFIYKPYTLFVRLPSIWSQTNGSANFCNIVYLHKREKKKNPRKYELNKRLNYDCTELFTVKSAVLN